jgi:hypothetical protein
MGGANLLRPPGEIGKRARAGLIRQQVTPASRTVRQPGDGLAGGRDRLEPKPLTPLQLLLEIGAGHADDQVEIGRGNLPVARVQVFRGSRRHPHADGEPVLDELGRASRRGTKPRYQEQRYEEVLLHHPSVAASGRNC